MTSEFPTVTTEQLYRWQQAGRSPVLIDVRSPAEYRAGHIPGAANISHTRLRGRLDEVFREITQPGGQSNG